MASDLKSDEGDELSVGSNPTTASTFLPVGVMVAQGSLKPLAFDRNEYRQLCYMSSLK